ncbi:LytR/AlgR family response regulator transcription factor [Pararcticibacter amylolyticus]|uniref:HTH LytTR-type domain-containing protein n=1 Tax=Pararcticibacter amylolyticus TaxID=2173175 RepID=A0A2U2P9A4_9SPHI|nr:LytTR family DNA-binding domain-containing protein [Pararcticibacter amylolyticus]PWG77978.1 hypothetical protein DDR33_24645 [Pararcticibacter amylolyticus]
MISYFLIGDNSTIDTLTKCIPTFSMDKLSGSSMDILTGFRKIVRTKPDVVFIDTDCVQIKIEELSLLKQLTMIVIISNNHFVRTRRRSQRLSNDHYSHYAFLGVPKIEASASIQEETKVYADQLETLAKMNIPTEQKALIKNNDVLFLRTNQKGIKGCLEVPIRMSNIVFVEAVKNYSHYHIANDTVLSAHSSLKDTESKLPAYFIRINKSFIVNAEYISGIEARNYLILNNNPKIKIPIGPTYRNMFNKWKTERGRSIDFKCLHAY